MTKLALLLLGLAAAAVSPAASIPNATELDRRATFSVTRYAALGDSFASGPSAGEKMDDTACKRYDQAYGPQLSKSNVIEGPLPRNFYFPACSGSKTKHIYTDTDPSSGGPGKDKISQAKALDGKNPEMVTLTIGGNDVKFGDILDKCVYRFYDVFKCSGCTPSWDGDCSASCQTALDASRDRIDSLDFFNSLKTAFDAIFVHAPSTRLFVTGYPAFWNAATDACDEKSFKVNCVNGNVLKLTKDRRQKMNELTSRINVKISQAVGSYFNEHRDRSITYVDVNHFFDGHRFCEPGVDEPSYQNPNIWFYPFEFDSGNTLMFDGSEVPSGDCDAVYDVDGDQGDYLACLMANSVKASGTPLNLADLGVSVPVNNDGNGDDAVMTSSGELPVYLARIFHPTVRGHQGISQALEEAYRNADSVSVPIPLERTNPQPGQEIASKVKLRLLCVGDSITVGFLSNQNGGNGDGYRRRLKDDLSKNEVVFAGTEHSGTMEDGYYAAWSGKTIKYIADHIGPSLKQRPNIILLHAGTNDMNPNPSISTEGNDPAGALQRLDALIDQMLAACPDAVILVAMIINTCGAEQIAATQAFQALIPPMASRRLSAGQHVLAVDFTSFPTAQLRDCIHPTNDGYALFGDYWYDFVTQIPEAWIKAPQGDDPDRPGDGGGGGDSGSNGGIDTNVPPPDWGADPVQPSSVGAVSAAAKAAGNGGRRICNGNPVWSATGKIALGLGHNGEWKFEKNWQEAGKVADGLHRDPKYVRLHDMNGDGKADYIWLDPNSGEIRCWLNNLPNPWSPAGTNNSIIGSGAGVAESIILADMNGDGMDDYMVVNPDNGAVRIWWNYGADDSWFNGWKFVEGGQIASGLRHANWATLRFPDINGDGRGDYVYIGEGGSLVNWMNTGSPGGQDVLFVERGGIATGAVSDISRLVFADMDGDGRDDYLIWDDQAGLTGFLNQPTRREGVPLYVNQGPAKTIADGITQKPSPIRLADMDGDGKDDYAYIDQEGAIWLWYNRGSADTSMDIDGIRFADIDGDGLDDYVWLDPKSGAPTVYFNRGPNSDDSLGWFWAPANGGKPIASGAAPASRVVFGDVNGDGLDDYLVLDPKTGQLTAYLNDGPDPSFEQYQWRFKPIGSIATGLGPGARVRFADIDGDGFDDYIYLKDNGGTTIYRNRFRDDTPDTDWVAMPDADASGIGQRPEEISFHDVNGDGRADYVWTRAQDGAARVWLNNYPHKPTWLEQPLIAGGVGTSGSNVRWAVLQDTGRASYVAVNPGDGAIAAWLNGCNDLGGEPDVKPNVVYLRVWSQGVSPNVEEWVKFDGTGSEEVDSCVGNPDVVGEASGWPDGGQYPTELKDFDTHGVKKCSYSGSRDSPGTIDCPGVRKIWCKADPAASKPVVCRNNIVWPVLVCRW